MLFIFSVIVVLVIVVILIGIITDGSSVAVSVVAAPLAVPCGRSSASAKGWTHAHAYTHAHTHAHVHAHAHHHNGHHHGHNTITHLVPDNQKSFLQYFHNTSFNLHRLSKLQNYSSKDTPLSGEPAQLGVFFAIFPNHILSTFNNCQKLTYKYLYKSKNILPQTRHQLEKQLDWENSHLYSKLGLRYPFKEQAGKKQTKKSKHKSKKNRPGELLLQHIIV